MKTFTYTYKSSDGVRHLEEMEADSKDTVFTKLRERGIRPVRVCEKESPAKSHRKMYFVWGSIGCLIAIACGVVALSGAGSKTARDAEVKPAEESTNPVDAIESASYKEALADLTIKANIVRNGFKASMKRIDFKNPMSGETNAFVRARGEISASRDKMRDLFRSLYQMFPPTAEVERKSAQRLYGEIMTEIDMVEERIEFEELKYASENL